MEVFNLLCFGAAPGVGNRAQMVLGGPADPAERQRWAAQARVNACVFIDGADHAPVLDYWYPHARSPLCLHATLAASHVLFARRPQAAQIEVATAMQGQHLALRREGSLTFIGLEAQLAPSCDVTQAELTAWFGRMPELVSAPAVASVGSPKLLLQVADEAALRALQPHLPAIVAWGRAQGINGCYVWCELGQGVYMGRNFNHLEPQLEDSATGVAAGALSLHLGRALTLLQGAHLGIPCRIRTRLTEDGVEVGGAVETV